MAFSTAKDATNVDGAGIEATCTSQPNPQENTLIHRPVALLPGERLHISTSWGSESRHVLQQFASFERTISPEFLGYPLRAFVLTNVKQRLLSEVAAALAGVPEVVEVYGLSGVSDLLIQVVARDADDLYRVAGHILGIRGVKRTTTALVMRELVDFRLTPLLDRLLSSKTPD